MAISRRQFLQTSFATASAIGLPMRSAPAQPGEPHYLYHGRTNDHDEFRVIDSGRKIERIETFTRGPFSLVRVTTNDGSQGYGQISTYDADISATVLHRKLAGHVLGQDPADIDSIIDRCIEANYKFPWSYVCRALAGVDTAIWDLYGKIKQQPVVQLLGGKARPYRVYGSSMRRDIKPLDEAARLQQLRDQFGYQAFKIRVGRVNGHNQDASPGRTEALIPAVRQAVGDDVELLADGNSGYTPDRAIQVGHLMEDHRFFQFEEPCPYWELEWTKEVTDALKLPVSGGEQDNDLAQWRRMIETRVVDIVQPDICYLGGLTRTLRVAKMAANDGLSIVPHSANLGLVTVFSVHLLGAVPRAAPYLEYTLEANDQVNREAQRLYAPALTVRDGQVTIPGDPGWGVTIQPAWLDAASRQVSELGR